ncbi:Glycine dehydrogenase [decarboxylating] [Serratia grimesii]|nr:Glycine dehydrogenase [decarboxylating] [Serratia grimesii]
MFHDDHSHPNDMLFQRRHIGPGNNEQQAMLAELQVSSLAELIDQIVPSSIRLVGPLALANGCSEAEALERLATIAARNPLFKSYIGMGYYDTHTPPVILRNLFENPAWYTAYTPYQPEISQGRLEALFNFQTMITDLTGLEIANASMLDEATAAAEAMTFCQRLSASRSPAFFVAHDCHPQTIDVVKTRAEPLGIDVVIGDPHTDLANQEYFGVLLQYPGTYGDLIDYRSVTEAAHAKGALVVVSADLLALTLLMPPGEFGADVAVGTTQRFGVPMGFGGPHAGYFATRDALKRSMPGRLVGMSVDSQGRPALRLAMQTREQHIRREKATSNICTAQALLAIIAAMYACYHGPEGLTAIAHRVHRLTTLLAAGLRRLGYRVSTDVFFDTLSIDFESADHANVLHAQARTRRINLRASTDTRISVSLDETTTSADVMTLLSMFALGKPVPDFAMLDAQTADALPPQLHRTSAFLTHPVFQLYRSETEMLRYLRHLADKDLALDRTMIPLGSCTMKLNATTEMIPVTWPEFGKLHPFAPAEQTTGYRELTRELEAMLCAITGYDAVSLQPNAGSQGEYAGLLAIRAYHASRGESQRDICLIPSSAHGTNPASAQMVNMKVVVVSCDESGNVDVDDLKTKAKRYSDTLAAIMITYPSTHGVFEERVREICDIVHNHGGQVYIDGANMNALVGLAQPGHFGGDVSHLNLHKTFCIPHGGGGPGIGPIGVKSHLAPYLPGHAVGSLDGGGAVSAAPYGSASILPITWTYITLMGADGLKRATEIAILNANYITTKLTPHYPILYTGPNGRVAHECIVDVRELKESSGISVEDIAKRLIDFGFHAPTMSFPVAGTLMIEPTESESKAELDRFIEAMVTIREEIRAVEQGRLDPEDNPLKHAPHTAAMLAGPWPYSYSREQAVFPRGLEHDHNNKYWPPVSRVDNVYGDRNLICSCPPLSSYPQTEDAPVQPLPSREPPNNRHHQGNAMSTQEQFSQPLQIAGFDDALWHAMEAERFRQEDHIELIASENYTSPRVIQAQGSVLTNKYAEGYPGKRYYGGCEYVDVVEQLAITRAKQLFGADYANVQPHSGSQANAAVYMALIQPHDTVLGMSLAHGGHLTHGASVNFSGKIYNAVQYGIDIATGLIDYDEVEKLALEHQPKLIVAGFSAYSRVIDWARFRAIADKVGAYLLVDMAHVAGLVAAGLYPNPVPFADVVTTTTHKTLRGPRGGLILARANPDIEKKLNSIVFPGIQGGPLMHVIAAKAVSFQEALQPSFITYQQQVIANARAMAAVFVERGYDIISGGTDNHLFLLSLVRQGLTGKAADAALGAAHITVNKNAVPNDPQSPFVTSGIRIGTPAATTRGFKEPEVRTIAGWICDILADIDNPIVINRVKHHVAELCAAFPVYGK